jgi:hypothetical protein
MGLQKFHPHVKSNLTLPLAQRLTRLLRKYLHMGQEHCNLSHGCVDSYRTMVTYETILSITINGAASINRARSPEA